MLSQSLPQFSPDPLFGAASFIGLIHRQPPQMMAALLPVTRMVDSSAHTALLLTLTRIGVSDGWCGYRTDQSNSGRIVDLCRQFFADRRSRSLRNAEKDSWRLKHLLDQIGGNRSIAIHDFSLGCAHPFPRKLNEIL